MAEKYEVTVCDSRVKARWLEVADETSYNKEITFAIQAVRGNDTLQKCDPESIRNAVINIALTGVTLNPALQQAYLVPRKGKCCLDISYRGLVKIAVDSGSVYDINAVAVFEGDEFYYEEGLDPILKHVPRMMAEEVTPRVIAVYAKAILHHGIKKFVVLDRWKIEQARKSSQTKNVWDSFYDEMAKKTAVKLLYKLLPQQTERMSSAISVLNEHDGIDTGQKAQEVMKRFGIQGSSADVPPQDFAPYPCPNKPETTFLKEHCDNVCKTRQDCPVWE